MGSEFKFGRRGLFAGALAGLGTSVENLHAAQKPGAAPRNIIWMVSDGMSPGVLPLADRLSRIVRGKGLVWHGLLSRPECAHGLMDMASLTSMVTDSSAASSAWGSGTRILNGMVNTLPDGTKLTPLAEIAHAGGKRVGLVTTATVTHATPAGQHEPGGHEVIWPQGGSEVRGHGTAAPGQHVVEERREAGHSEEHEAGRDDDREAPHHHADGKIRRGDPALRGQGTDERRREAEPGERCAGCKQQDGDEQRSGDRDPVPPGGRWSCGDDLHAATVGNPRAKRE